MRNLLSLIVFRLTVREYLPRWPQRSGPDRRLTAACAAHGRGWVTSAHVSEVEGLERANSVPARLASAPLVFAAGAAVGLLGGLIGLGGAEFGLPGADRRVRFRRPARCHPQ